MKPEDPLQQEQIPKEEEREGEKKLHLEMLLPSNEKRGFYEDRGHGEMRQAIDKANEILDQVEAGETEKKGGEVMQELDEALQGAYNKIRSQIDEKLANIKKQMDEISSIPAEQRPEVSEKLEKEYADTLEMLPGAHSANQVITSRSYGKAEEILRNQEFDKVWTEEMNEHSMQEMFGMPKEFPDTFEKEEETRKKTVEKMNFFLGPGEQTAGDSPMQALAYFVKHVMPDKRAMYAEPLNDVYISLRERNSEKYEKAYEQLQKLMQEDFQKAVETSPDEYQALGGVEKNSTNDTINNLVKARAWAEEKALYKKIYPEQKK